MGGLRFLPLLAIAACADLSGLNGLEVRDGAVIADASSQDALVDTDADGSIADAPIDVPLPMDASAQGFCPSQTETYLWCADFDKNDVTKGYLNGQPAQWTGVSQTPPTISKANSSAPYSASFDGALSQSLTFTGSPSNSVPYAFSGMLRVESLTDGAHDVASVQTNASYGIKVQAVRAGLTSFSFTLIEATLGDAGLVLTPHPITSTVTLGNWVAFSLSITSQQFAVKIGNDPTQTFDRAQTGGSLSTTTTLVFDQPTSTGQWDNILISM